MSKAILITFTYTTFTRKCKRLTRNWQRNILTHHEYGFYFSSDFFLFLPNAYNFIHKLVIHQIKEQYSCLNYSFLSSIVLCWKIQFNYVVNLFMYVFVFWSCKKINIFVFSSIFFCFTCLFRMNLFNMLEEKIPLNNMNSKQLNNYNITVWKVHIPDIYAAPSRLHFFLYPIKIWLIPANRIH